MILTVRGAYGRQYESGDAAIHDWEGGMDFQTMNQALGGMYVSLADKPMIEGQGYALLCFCEPTREGSTPLAYYSLAQGQRVGLPPLWPAPGSEGGTACPM